MQVRSATIQIIGKGKIEKEGAKQRKVEEGRRFEVDILGLKLKNFGLQIRKCENEANLPFSLTYKN